MVSRNPPHPVRSASLTTGNDCVAAAADLTHGFIAEHGLEEGAAARLAIVVEELVCNLVDHAGLTGSMAIQLRLERITGGVALTLTDPGPPFDLRGAPPPADLPPERGGGAGLAMVRAWARIDRYQRFEGINELALTLED